MSKQTTTNRGGAVELKVIGAPGVFEARKLFLNATDVASELEWRMGERFPESRWVAVIGGEDTDEWDILVELEHYGVPTEREEEFALQVINSLIYDDETY